MNKNNTIIIASLAVIVLAVIAYIIIQHQKFSEAIAAKLDQVSDKLDDITYRQQAVELANYQLHLEAQKPLNPIGFKIADKNDA